MIKYLNCDCISSKCSAIVNQVNLSGNMDFQSGMEFSIRFPKMYQDYLNRYRENRLELHQSYLFEEDGQKIINMVCYDSYAFPTTMTTVEKALKYFVKNYKEFHIHEIAFPLLGCDEDGLRMVNILPLMEKYLKLLPIDCYICFDVEGPSNLEFQMIQAFQDDDFKHLKTYAELDDIQIASLENIRHRIIRFEEIYHLDGMNAESYRRIYRYFYTGEYKKHHPYRQASFFD